MMSNSLYCAPVPNVFGARIGTTLCEKMPREVSRLMNGPAAVLA